MLLLLIALLQASASSQETKATLQSCETTEKGWVCHYQIPSATIVSPLEPSSPPVMAPPASVPLVAPPQAQAPAPVAAQTAAPTLAPTKDSEAAEAGRQTRLIARCADAKWYSPCLPGERTEARVLRDAAISAATLRGKVTTLLSDQRCDEAVKVALAGGDLALAREARAFCAAPR